MKKKNEKKKKGGGGGGGQRMKEQTTNASGKETKTKQMLVAIEKGCPSHPSKQLTPNKGNKTAETTLKTPNGGLPASLRWIFFFFNLKKIKNKTKQKTHTHKNKKTNKQPPPKKTPNHNGLIVLSGRIQSKPSMHRSKNNCANDKQRESQTNSN